MEEELTLKEVRSLRDRLEDDLTKLLLEFETETGLCVVGIDYFKRKETKPFPHVEISVKNPI